MREKAEASAVVLAATELAQKCACAPNLGLRSALLSWHTTTKGSDQ